MDKQLRITLLLLIDSAFAIIELVSGYAVHSLALVADSFHMFNDILSLVVALWAVKAAKSGASATFSYGLQRAEILGALVNAVFLLALCVTIFLEAIQRFVEPQEITNPVLILVVGCFGLLSNLVGLVLFNEHGHSHGGLGGHSHGTTDAESNGVHDHDHEHGHGHSHGHEHGHSVHRPLLDESQHISSLLPESALAREEQLLLSSQQGYGSTQHGGPVLRRSRATSVHNAHEEHNHRRPKPAAGPSRSMNMEGVFLHVLGDALGNVGVIITALFIWKTNFSWRFYCDPLVSLFITAIIFSSALPLCMRASKVLLQATPSTVNGEEVAQDIQSLPGVEEIHDLHIWQLSEDQLVATLHVTVNSAPADFPKLATTIQECLSDYGIPSITIQPEFANTSDSRSGAQPLCRAKSSNNLNAA